VKIPTADIPVTQSPSILYTLAPLSFLLCLIFKPYILQKRLKHKALPL